MGGVTHGRLAGRHAVVFGGGQTPGLSVGNGRAVVLRFAAEGARVIVVDRDFDAAEETATLVRADGGDALALAADVTDEAQIVAAIGRSTDLYGPIDILHNNVGASLAVGDAEVEDITAEAFDRVTRINLRSMVLTCKHTLPIMRAQRSGVIVNVSSLATRIDYRNIGYKTSKAGVDALTTTLAISNAGYGIRANAILPGLIDTPMAIEPRVGRSGATRDSVVAERNARVPLGSVMGSAWDVANAALFLASDEARFVTGVLLPVDGGQSLRVG